MKKRKIVHYKPGRHVPFREALKYQYITACNRRINTGDDSKVFLNFSEETTEVTCKGCQRSDIFLKSIPGKSHLTRGDSVITLCGLDLSGRDFHYPEPSLGKEIRIGRMCKNCLRTNTSKKMKVVKEGSTDHG